MRMFDSVEWIRDHVDLCPGNSAEFIYGTQQTLSDYHMPYISPEAFEASRNQSPRRAPFVGKLKRFIADVSVPLLVAVGSENRIQSVSPLIRTGS
jgi:hypothetical protein